MSCVYFADGASKSSFGRWSLSSRTSESLCSDVFHNQDHDDHDRMRVLLAVFGSRGSIVTRKNHLSLPSSANTASPTQAFMSASPDEDELIIHEFHSTSMAMDWFWQSDAQELWLWPLDPRNKCSSSTWIPIQILDCGTTLSLQPKQSHFSFANPE